MGHNSLLHLILFPKCRGTFFIKMYSSHYDPRLKYIHHLPAGEKKCPTTHPPVARLGPLTVKCTSVTWAMALQRGSWSEPSVITAH